MPEYQLKDGRMLLIRPASPDDAVPIIAYMNRVGGESDYLLRGKDEFTLSEEAERSFLEGFAQETNSRMLTGWIGGELVAIADLSGGHRPRIAHNAELGMTVSRSCWGLGVGSRMMEELLAFARSAGLENIRLTVYADNIRARKLYEKFGFREIGCCPDYFRVNGVSHDAIDMLLALGG